MLETKTRCRKQPGKPQVWIAQVKAQHYRLPVWDLLVERYSDRFDLNVYAGLNGGLPYGAKHSRPYIQELKPERTDRLRHIFSGLPALIKEHRPDVLVIETPLRLYWSWRLPVLCKQNEVVPVAWSKVWTTPKFRHLPQPLLKLIKGNLYRRYGAHVVYGKTSREELLSFGVSSERVFVAQNTIDTRRDRDMLRALAYKLRADHGLLDAKILLVIARMGPDKRHRDILNAWPELRSLDDGLCLVLVGSGPLAHQIQAQVENLNDPRVHLLGRVPEGHDYGWIAAADFNLQLGAVGLAVNQSMAFGTATVIADEPGPDTETVVHERTGWRYPKGDLKALVTLMRRLLSEPESVELVVEEAHRIMRYEVNIDKMVDQFGGAIQAALEQKKIEI